MLWWKKNRATSADFAATAVILPIEDEKHLLSAQWVEAAKRALNTDGAVLLRSQILRKDGAEIALGALDGELLQDAFWSTPRSRVSDKTLTATEYPSERTISLHSEMSYMKNWPRLIAFHSIKVAEEGGETTICNIDAVSSELGNTLTKFHDHGVTYHRRFQKRIDIPWQQAFQTEDRAQVESICLELGMKVEWLARDGLATSHTAQGTFADEAGRPIYFNQAHIFHPSALAASARQALERTYGVDCLPRMATYGDGTAIADAELAEVRTAFSKHQMKMHWQQGDILILDNMRFAHGRLPFRGTRQLHVALAREVRAPVRDAL